MRVAIAIVSLLAPAGPLLGQAIDSTTLRPTSVVVTIRNDAHYDGVYRARGISRICGKLDLMMPHRVNSFVVEFPDDEPDLAVPSLTFDADTLPAGTTTESFQLAVSVRTEGGGRPPAFVVRARKPEFGEPGTAARTKSAGRDSLVVAGTATSGTKVEVKVTVACDPKP